MELYFERHGQGPALVLLHGGLLNIAANFSQLLPPLTENHEVIAIELQGHGRTADSGRAMSLECFADDVAALLAYLSIEKADVFGFSLGAMVALTLALSHPGVVNKLVLASVDHSPNHDQFVRPEDPAIMARLPTEADFARLRTSYAEIAPRPGDFDVLAERTTAMVHSLKGWSEEDSRPSRHRRWSSLETPTWCHCITRWPCSRLWRTRSWPCCRAPRTWR